MSMHGITASMAIKQGCGLLSFGLGGLGLYEAYTLSKEEKKLKNWLDLGVDFSWVLMGATTPVGIAIISSVVHKIFADKTSHQIISNLSSFEVGKLGHTIGTIGIFLMLPRVLLDYNNHKQVSIKIAAMFSIIAISSLGLHYEGMLLQAAKNHFLKA